MYIFLEKSVVSQELKDKVNINDPQRIAMEAEAIRKAEAGQLDEALALIDKAINAYPEHPSPRNNRAQILRLLHKDTEALTDLHTTLSLATPDYPLVQRQAHAQRAWLRMAREELAGAKEDFEAAAALGHPDADRMAVRCNPYAAMCNAMLAQVMQKYYS